MNEVDFRKLVDKIFEIFNLEDSIISVSTLNRLVKGRLKGLINNLL